MNTLTGTARDKDRDADRKFVQALARGLDISRLTYTLTNMGYLTYSERLEK
jgi:hypothetical protein